VIENRICEGTDRLKAALSSGVTSVHVMVVLARSVSCGSNEAVTLLYLVSSPSSTTYSQNTRFETFCFTALTGISSDTADSSLLPLLFLRSLSSPIINL